jgi:DNA-binding transcriptional ArsR family regulator
MPTDQLSATFSALADPTRRAMLARLREQGETTVTQLAEPFHMTVQAVSKHLAVLERAGLVDRSRSAQLRPARLRATYLREAAEWLQFYAFWDASFDILDKRLAERSSDD